MDVVTDTKENFHKIFKTTNVTCLQWFQYKMLYRLRPTGHFLFQRKLVDSPYCAFCKDAEETILHMFWECPKVQDFWLEVQGWLHKHFEHCTNITFSKELIILGVRANLVTDRIIDLCILIAKYHIFTSKLQGTIPHLYAFVQNMKNRSEVEKYYYIVNSRPNNFYIDLILYRSYFP